MPNPESELEEIRKLCEADHVAGKHGGSGFGVRAERAACHICTPDEVLERLLP